MRMKSASSRVASSVIASQSMFGAEVMRVAPEVAAELHRRSGVDV
jgi:hypothetical protein